MRMTYDKQDAHMTRGMAILSMLVLHLFCRTGGDVFGTPLLWFNSETPVVYWFGYFAEICVTVYSLCVGYAQQVMAEGGRPSWLSNLWRIGRLMTNYWIVVGLFSILGLLFDAGGGIPGSLTDFLKSIFLLHSYNGAWWYLHSYVFLLLIPPKVLLYPVKKLPVWLGLSGCLLAQVAWYCVGRFGLLPDSIGSVSLVEYIWTELKNLIGILPAVYVGAFLCKGKAVTKVGTWANKHFSRAVGKWLLLLAFLVLFLGFNLVHKAALVGITGVATFLLFNLWDKSKWTQKLFLFLGKHSTNIWLTHMFFYVYLFVGLVQKAKYPVLMLLFMLALCIASSYVIIGIDKGIRFGIRKIRSARRRGTTQGG